MSWPLAAAQLPPRVGPAAVAGESLPLGGTLGLGRFAVVSVDYIWRVRGPKVQLPKLRLRFRFRFRNRCRCKCRYSRGCVFLNRKEIEIESQGRRGSLSVFRLPLPLTTPHPRSLFKSHHRQLTAVPSAPLSAPPCAFPQPHPRLRCRCHNRCRFTPLRGRDWGTRCSRDLSVTVHQSRLVPSYHTRVPTTREFVGRIPRHQTSLPPRRFFLGCVLREGGPLVFDDVSDAVSDAVSGELFIHIRSNGSGSGSGVLLWSRSGRQRRGGAWCRC
jgi:hypothetical protein